MLKETPRTVRNADLIMLDAKPAQGALTSRFVRGQNFLVEWLDVTSSASHKNRERRRDDASSLRRNGRHFRWRYTVSIPQRSVAVLPAGDYEIRLNGPASACILSTSRKGRLDAAANAQSYASADVRVRQLVLRGGASEIRNRSRYSKSTRSAHLPTIRVSRCSSARR